MSALPTLASPRNPDWSRDEVILALDVYLQHEGRVPAREFDPLSKLLRRLNTRLGISGDDRFRNPAGVGRKMGNFQSLDSRFTDRGLVGLKGASATDRVVWQEFSHHPTRYRQAAEAIRQVLNALPASAVDERDADVVTITEAPEGRLLTRQHVAHERNRKLVEARKRQAMHVHGRLQCEGCNFDFAIVYGARGQGFIECHHTRPVSTLGEDGVTKLTDLALVCANCHRMIHARSNWLSIAELHDLVQLGGV